MSRTNLPPVQAASRSGAGQPTRLNRLIPLMLLVVSLCVGLRLWLPQYVQWQVLREIEQAGGYAEWRPSPRTWLQAYLPDELLQPYHDLLTLDLKAMPVSDEVLARLERMPRLETLILAQADITDAGLTRLQDCAELRWLYLIDCPQITPAAIARLKTALPLLDIQRRGSAFLGVSGMPSPGGLTLREVQHMSSAWRAGLAPGDTICTADGQPVPDFETLAQIIGQHVPGDPLALEIQRRTQRLHVTPVLDGWK